MLFARSVASSSRDNNERDVGCLLGRYTKHKSYVLNVCVVCSSLFIGFLPRANIGGNGRFFRRRFARSKALVDSDRSNCLRASKKGDFGTEADRDGRDQFYFFAKVLFLTSSSQIAKAKVVGSLSRTTKCYSWFWTRKWCFFSPRNPICFPICGSKLLTNSPIYFWVKFTRVIAANNCVQTWVIHAYWKLCERLCAFFRSSDVHQKDPISISSISRPTSSPEKFKQKIELRTWKKKKIFLRKLFNTG